MQDAAYGTLLREPRRVLHARVAETLEDQFTEIAERQPELLARHCTEAGQIAKAASFWGKAGQRSLERSALVEAIEQFTHALDLIATLSATPALRREQIKLQVALIAPLHHVKGYGASETKAAVERARLLIERAEALGEPPEDPLLLFLILYGFWVANFVAFNGDVCHDLAAHFLELAKRQKVSTPLVLGHNLMGTTLLLMGDIAEARRHLDKGIAHYDPAKDRPLALRIGQDARVTSLSFRSLALWMLGYPEAALVEADQALVDARRIGQAATLMTALSFATLTYALCRDFATSDALVDELIHLADQKGSFFWKPIGMLNRGRNFALNGRSSEAIDLLATGLTASRSTGTTFSTMRSLLNLASAYADLSKFDDAWRCIREASLAIETTNERWFEAEAHCVAGEVALKSPERDAAKVEAHFGNALRIARTQQAKSWELRAATRMARLWCDQGKRDAARDLLAPVYDWFTEGLDTLDLKEAKALLDALA